MVLHLRQSVDMFATGGVRPACLHQWTSTQYFSLQSMVATFGLV